MNVGLALRLIVAALLAAPSSAIPGTPTATASALNGQNGALDTPSSFEKRSAHGPRGQSGRNDEWEITCLHFPGYTIKLLESPGNKGAVIVSSQSTSAAGPPRCGEQDDPGEKVIADGYYLVGARGGFAITQSPDGYDFTIEDALSGRHLYSDTSAFIERASFSVRADVLTVAYTRAVVANCSLLTGGAACWAQIAHDAKLPSEIARMPAPVAECEKAYQRFADSGDKNYRSGASVVTYLATVAIERYGRSTVLNRTHLSCEPSP